MKRKNTLDTDSRRYLEFCRRDLARLEKLNAGDYTALERLPVCPIHGDQMDLHKPGTPEQEFCGTWYRCPQCGYSTLYPSVELLRQLVSQG